jgi:8-oxo-dGTP diphosphatase
MLRDFRGIDGIDRVTTSHSAKRGSPSSGAGVASKQYKHQCLGTNGGLKPRKRHRIFPRPRWLRYTRFSMSQPRPTQMPPWGEWQPVDRATLVFVLRGDEVLLIRKLRGLGMGKINGPGGRIEPGETKVACARREVEEELCVTPLELQERGELRFQFVDGYSIQAFVFVASGCSGEPTATSEAIPLWTPCSQIPYDEMWADDSLWIPAMLSGKWFRGRFLFDGDRMVEHEVSADGEANGHASW